MSLVVKDDGKTYQLAPADVHRAVCVDVVDLGMVHNEKYGKTQHKGRIVWELDALMDDGRPFTTSRRFTLSLNEKSALRPFLEAWRGRPFTAEELAGFDLEKLIGVACMLQVQHQTSTDGKTYANVVTVMRLPRGTAPLQPSGHYTRVKDRKPEPDEAGYSDADVPAEEEESVPF